MPAIYFIPKGDGVWGDLQRNALWIADPERWQLAVLNDGMSSGQPSIGLRLEVRIPQHQGNGHRHPTQTVIAETSVDAWMMATAAIKGTIATDSAPLEDTIAAILTTTLQALAVATAAGTIPQDQAVAMMARSVAGGIQDRVIDVDSP